MADKKNMTIYEAHRNPPKEALKPIGAGRLKGMTDINPMWRIKALTEQFGACGIGWYYTTDEQRVEDCGNEKVAIVNISLFVKVDGEWSKPIFGTGGAKLIAQERGGAYVSDEAFKMATTDAISVACKQLGFAADIYWQSDRDKYTANDPVSGQQKQEKTDEELDQEMRNSVDPDLVPNPKRTHDERIAKIKAEQERTGITDATLLSFLGVKNWDSLTDAQFVTIISKLKKTKSKS